MIITRTPFRISFFGGGTDYPAWYQNHGGAVLASTIDKYCYISCRYLPQFFEHRHRIVYSKIENVKSIGEISHPAVRAVLDYMGVDEGLEIHHDGDLPARSGLGSSSSFTVGLINALMALNGKYVSKEDLASRAIHVEQDLLKENVGSQDQVSAAFGGFNLIEFERDDTFQVTPIVLSRGRLDELQGRLMLFFTGLSRISSDIAKSQIENIGNKEMELKHIRSLVGKAIGIVQDPTRGIDDFGRLLDETWQYKRSLSDKVSTPEIDTIYDSARKAGAIGGKLLGAGGGGFLLLFVPPDSRDRVRASLGKLVHVPFKFEHSGSRIVLYQPDGL